MTDFKPPDTHAFVVFTLENMLCALPVSAVERVIHSVEISPLPKAPSIVLGVISLHGEILPVIDIRILFHLPKREIGLEDHFIVTRTAKRIVVLRVDSVSGVHEISSNSVMRANESFPYTGYISGLANLDTEIVCIHDIDSFLSLDDERALDAALTAGHT